MWPHQYNRDIRKVLHESSASSPCKDKTVWNTVAWGGEGLAPLCRSAVADTFYHPKDIQEIPILLLLPRLSSYASLWFYYPQLLCVSTTVSSFLWEHFSNRKEAQKGAQCFTKTIQTSLLIQSSLLPENADYGHLGGADSNTPAALMASKSFMGS